MAKRITLAVVVLVLVAFPVALGADHNPKFIVGSGLLAYGEEVSPPEVVRCLGGEIDGKQIKLDVPLCPHPCRTRRTRRSRRITRTLLQRPRQPNLLVRGPADRRPPARVPEVRRADETGPRSAKVGQASSESQSRTSFQLVPTPRVRPPAVPQASPHLCRPQALLGCAGSCPLDNQGWLSSSGSHPDRVIWAWTQPWRTTAGFLPGIDP